MHPRLATSARRAADPNSTDAIQVRRRPYALPSSVYFWPRRFVACCDICR